MDLIGVAEHDRLNSPDLKGVYPEFHIPSQMRKEHSKPTRPGFDSIITAIVKGPHSPKMHCAEIRVTRNFQNF